MTGRERLLLEQKNNSQKYLLTELKYERKV